jgi:uncharacterized protein YjbI with pentapeptide repeats
MEVTQTQKMKMLYEDKFPENNNLEKLVSDDNVFRYVTFENMQIATAMDGIFINCTFQNMEFYWTLFNQTILIDCKFLNVNFSGVNIVNAKFVKCKFDRCTFRNDNIGGCCRYENITWCENEFINCENPPHFDPIKGQNQ